MLLCLPETTFPQTPFIFSFVPKKLDKQLQINKALIMSAPAIHAITTNNKDCLFPLEGFIAVISPDMPWTPSYKDNQGTPVYHLKETAIVLMWTTRQGRKITTWVKDVLNNTWIVLDKENVEKS